MEVANALAYYVTVTITAAKSFFVQAPVVSNLYTISVVASMRLQKIYCSIKLIFFSFQSLPRLHIPGDNLIKLCAL